MDGELAGGGRSALTVGGSEGGGGGMDGGGVDGGGVDGGGVERSSRTVLMTCSGSSAVVLLVVC